MKTKIGIPIGLALVMFLGVFAAMLAFGTLSPEPTQAQTTPSATRSFDRDSLTPTDTNRQVVVSIDIANATIGSVTETLPAGFTYVSANGAGSVNADNLPNVVFTLDFEAPDFTYTVTAPATLGEHMFSGTLSTARGTADDVTVRGPTTVTVSSTPVEIPMMVSGFMVDNTVNTPGTVSGYRITFITAADLVANQDVITVHFDKDFKGHGADLSKDHVTVSASFATGSATTETDGPSQTGAFNPSSNAALDRLTRAKHHLSDKNALNNIEYQILVPDMNGTSDGAPGIAEEATVTVVISTGAGITNATEGSEIKADGTGGKGPIGVFTSKQDTLAYANVSIDRSIALSSYASNRNKALTVVGSGFQNGTTATVYLENDNGDRQELVAVPVASDDTFEAQITVTVPPFVAGTGNMIFAEDGNEPPFTAGPLPFEVEGLLAVSPTSAAVGDEVDITLTDWPNDGPIPADAVTIAGEPQKIIGSHSVSGGSANFRIKISTETPSGTDEIKVNTPALGENDTVKITISGADLNVDVTTVVPNQVITLSGHGFTGQSTINRSTAGISDGSMVRVGNSAMHLQSGTRNFNSGQEVTISSGGTWSASLIIPITTATTSPGTHMVEVEDSGNRSGSVEITIPERTLTIEPAVARPGEWVTLTGSGFPSDNGRSKEQSTPSVSIMYADDDAGTARPDSSGTISLRFVVPRDTTIPSTNRVEAVYTIPGTSTLVRTSTNHEVPGARIMLAASEGSPGDTLTVTGDGFKSFTSIDFVKIGGIEVTPAPKPATNRDGEFTASILVPDLAPGANSVEISVGMGTESGATANANFKILDESAITMMPEVMMAEEAAPDVAFAAVIAEDNLIAVYHFDPATQNEAPNYGYTIYDARPLFMSGNNLDSIEPGQFYTVEVSEDQMGVTLGSQTVDLYAAFTPIRW